MTEPAAKQAAQKPLSSRKSVPVVVKIHGRDVDLSSVTRAQLDAWKRECLDALPADKTYQVLYADPPWAYQENGNVEGKPGYPTMALHELTRLPVSKLAASTSVLFLWATNPLLPQALKLIEAWGFEYKTVFKVWLKRTAAGDPLCGCGWWSRPSTELVLVATKGSGYMKWKKTCNEPQEFASPRTKHSKKPDEIRAAVRDFMEVPHRIELFARTVCKGFDAWGLEIPGFFHSTGNPSAAHGGDISTH
jgi:N6-adenosine-specific RNA methylase IME4